MVEVSLQAAKAWSRKSRGGDAESGSAISSSSPKEPMAAATPSKSSTGLMSWLKLNKEGPAEHQGVSRLHMWLDVFPSQVRELPGYQFASPTPRSMKEVTCDIGGTLVCKNLETILKYLETQAIL